MPIRRGTLTTPPFIPTPTRSWGVPLVSWIDPTDTEWPLSNGGLPWFLADGVAGIGSIAATLTSDPHPRGGDRIRSIRSEPRIVTLPLYAEGADTVEYIGVLRQLGDAFMRTWDDGPGTLRIRYPDGSERRIDGVCMVGPDDSGRGDMWRWGLAPVQIFCEDGHWYDPRVTQIERAYSAGGASFFAPYPRVSSGRTLGSTTLTNPGEVIAWPEWEIDGPADEIVATNERTGEVFTITPPGGLLAGDTITISTDPPRIIAPDGSDALGWLTLPGSTLWGLPRGDSVVDFAIAGSAPGTAIRLSFNPRFRMR